MSDDKKSDADPGKELIGAIQTQHKVLFVAGLTLLLFWLSPRSNELLRAGKAELEGEQCDTSIKYIRDSIRGMAAGRCARASVIDALTDAGFDTQKVRPGNDTARAKCEKAPPVTDASGNDGDELLRAVGVEQPSTLADYVKLSNGETLYCSPRVEPTVLSGLSILHKRKTGFTVTGVRIMGVSDADAVVAAKALLAKSISTGQQLLDLPTGDAGADVAPRLKPSPRPPSTRIDVVAGKATVVDNEAAVQKWIAEQDALAKERDATKRTKMITEKAEKDLRDAASILRLAMNDFDRAAHMQVATGKSEPPRFLSARLELTPGTVGEDDASTDYLAFPLACEPRAVAVADAGPLAPSLVLTPDWKELKDIKPDGARRVVAASVRKGGETIELAGLKLHEDELVRFGPLLLAGLWLWHLLHVIRLRRVPDAVEAAGAAALIPTFPARQNLYLPFVTATLTVSAMIIFTVRTETSTLGRVFAVGCALVAAIAVALTCKGAPQVQDLPAPREVAVPDLDTSGSGKRGK